MVVGFLLLKLGSRYFLTYKLVPGQESKTSIEKIYDKKCAIKVVEAALKDYNEEYGN